MDQSAQRWPRARRAAWPALLAAIVLGPMLVQPGYLFRRDGVATPRSFLTDAALGVSDSAPRAVPQDAAVAAASTVLDGGIVVIAALMLGLWAAGWGAAHMASTLLADSVLAGAPSGAVAATVAVWNPYVAERLLQGQWSLLIGYAALPWVVTASVAITRSRRGGWGLLAISIGVAALTPTGSILATVMAVAVLAIAGLPRHVLGALGIGFAAATPWLVATLTTGAGTGSDPSGVAAFSARAEPGLGTLGSVLGLGGIWNADAVPASRTTLFAVVGTVLLLAVAGVGARRLWLGRTRAITAVVIVGVVSVAVAALGATGWGIATGEAAARTIPGAGLARDGHKWVALWMPALALAAATGVSVGTRYLGGRVRVAATVAAVLVALPDLVWGVGGALTPVRYPSSWTVVADAVTATDGDVAVLPAGTYRRFEWANGVPTLDPAPRFLRAPVLTTGELVVDSSAVGGEGTRAAQVESALLSGSGIDVPARLGVGWILVEKRTPGPLGDSARTLAGLEPVIDDENLALYRVPGTAVISPDHSARLRGLAGHAVWAVLIVGGLIVALAGRHARRPRHG